MESLRWLAENWFTLLNVVGIVGGLCFTGYSLRSETKTRRIANLLSLTGGHREIWSLLFNHPALGRVVAPHVDGLPKSLTPQEELFVVFVVQHLNAVVHAMQDDLTINPDGLRRDVFWFFSLPIPQAVWEKIKPLQDEELVAFIESCRNWK